MRRPPCAHLPPSITTTTTTITELPAACPVAGMLNGLLFPEDPADHNVLGQHARFLVVNDPHHALQTEYLQRTMPYFYRPKRDPTYVFGPSICIHT